MTKLNKFAGTDVQALREKAEAIEHKNWTAFQTTMHAEMFVYDDQGFLDDGVVSGPTYKKTNTEFIAAADPATVLALLDTVDSLKAELALADKAFRSLKDSSAKRDSELVLLKRELGR